MFAFIQSLINSEFYLQIIYISYFVCSFTFSLLIYILFLKFVKTLGIHNNEDRIIRWSSQTKPALGGICFYIVFLLSIISCSFIFEKSQYFLNSRFLGIILSCTLGFLMGLFDDAYNTKPFLKFFTQLTCGFVLIFTGTYIHFFNNIYLDYLLTLFWVIGIMNSINMLDNMDSISTTVSASIVGCILIHLFLINDLNSPYVLILIGLLASLFAFFRFNWHPSKMYMGDTGSQFLGIFLAAMGIIFFWNINYTGESHFYLKQLISVSLIFSIPIIDTTTVFIKRLLKKKSPFVGGKDHTTHHLSYLGLSDRQVAFIVIGISIISIFLNVIVLHYITEWGMAYFSLFALYFLALFLTLFFIALKSKSKAK
jgi:UDP-GlcNAc:undecaprenyl-phosphate GlcNAc-1-phosphate transferase